MYPTIHFYYSFISNLNNIDIIVKILNDILMGPSSAWNCIPKRFISGFVWQEKPFHVTCEKKLSIIKNSQLQFDRKKIEKNWKKKFFWKLKKKNCQKETSRAMERFFPSRVIKMQYKLQKKMLKKIVDFFFFLNWLLPCSHSALWLGSCMYEGLM